MEGQNKLISILNRLLKPQYDSISKDLEQYVSFKIAQMKSLDLDWYDETVINRDIQRLKSSLALITEALEAAHKNHLKILFLYEDIFSIVARYFDDVKLEDLINFSQKK